MASTEERHYEYSSTQQFPFQILSSHESNSRRVSRASFFFLFFFAPKANGRTIIGWSFDLLHNSIIENSPNMSLYMIAFVLIALIKTWRDVLGRGCMLQFLLALAKQSSQIHSHFRDR